MTHIKRFLYAGLIAMVALLPTIANAQTPLTTSALVEQINALIKKYPSVVFHGEIASVESGATIYANGANVGSHPASNMKLFTTSTALDVLGPDFTIRTSVYTKNPPQNGVINGDLILYGRGDPTLLDTSLENLAQQLQDKGVTTINGSVVGDEGYLTGASIPPGRDEQDLESAYGAEVGALNVYENLVAIYVAPGAKIGAKPIVTQILPKNSYITIINNAKTGSSKAKATYSIKRGLTNNTFIISGVIPLKYGTRISYLSIHNPAAYAASMMRDTLIRHNIAVKGGVRTTTTPTNTDDMTELAYVESKPLSEIITETNKRSANLFAELLLRITGKHTQSNSSTTTSETLGITAITNYLRSLGINNSIKITDGSGLGDGQSVTPHATVSLLQALAHSDDGHFIFDSLPIAGLDGTLKNRFKGTLAQGILKAKTGTIDTVSTLSGVIPTASGDTLAFSFFTTHKPKSASGKILIDKITVLLASYARTH